MIHHHRLYSRASCFNLRIDVFASAWITVVRFCCFRSLLLRSLGGGGVGGGEGVDNVQFCIHRTVQVTNSSVFTGSGAFSA